MSLCAPENAAISIREDDHANALSGRHRHDGARADPETVVAERPDGPRLAEREPICVAAGRARYATPLRTERRDHVGREDALPFQHPAVHEGDGEAGELVNVREERAGRPGARIVRIWTE